MHNIPSIWFAPSFGLMDIGPKVMTRFRHHPADGKKIADVSLASKNQDYCYRRASGHSTMGTNLTYYSWAILKIASHLTKKGLLDVTRARKPLAQARAEVAYAASFFEWFGEEE